MRTQKIEEKQRISKGTGRTMIAVAIFFDLLPFILILITIGIMVSLVGDHALQQASTYATANTVLENTSWWNFDAKYYALKNKAVSGVNLLAGGATAIAASAMIGPIIYTVGSFLAVFFGYFLFTVWFLFKGVNMWSFRSVQRVMVNVTAGLIEMIPLVNLLPGITLMVWRHVKLSQMEDRAENIENAHSISKQLARASAH